MFGSLAPSPIEIIWVIVSTVLFILLLSAYILTYRLAPKTPTQASVIVNTGYTLMGLLLLAVLGGAWITLLAAIERGDKLPTLIARQSLMLIAATALVVGLGILLTGWRLGQRKWQHHKAEKARLNGGAAASAKSRLQSATDVNPKPDPAAATPLHSVLIVDDDPHIVHLLEKILYKAGYNVRTATDGEEALSAVLTAAPDVILADLVMPETDGFGFIEQMRFLPETEKLPIIVVTAKMLKTGEKRWLDQRAIAVLQKDNLKSEILLESVSAAIEMDADVYALPA